MDDDGCTVHSERSNSHQIHKMKEISKKKNKKYF